jgi:hypothetical protein
MRFIEFIQEDIVSGTLTIFDVDETLFHTTAKVHVVKNGERLKSLSNQEFNTHKLEPDHEFDFRDFSDAEKFFNESKPIRRMMLKAQIILKNSIKNPLSKVIIITARPNFDNKEKFLATFLKHGLDIHKIYVERAGNMTGDMNPAVRKAIIIHKYLSTRKYGKVRLFDDSMSNLKAFLKLQDQFPTIKFEAFFAETDGKIKTIR